MAIASAREVPESRADMEMKADDRVRSGQRKLRVGFRLASRFAAFRSASVGHAPFGRLLRGTAWSVVGAVASRSSALLASIIVGRVLGASGFGRFGVVQVTVGLAATFAGFGLGVTATKHVAGLKAADRATAGRLISTFLITGAAFGFVFAVALGASSRWLARNTLADYSIAPLLQISSLSLLFGSVSGVQMGVLAGLEAFRSSAWLNIVTGLLAFPIMAIGVITSGLEGAVWAIVVSAAVMAVAGHVMLRREMDRQQICFLTPAWREAYPTLRDFSLPATMASLTITPVNWAAAAMLINYGGGFSELGRFNAANQWFSAMLFLPMALGQALLPVLSERLCVGDVRGARRLLTRSCAMNVAVTTPLAVTVALCSPALMRLYGRDFGSAWPVLVVVLATAVLLSGQSPVGQGIIASGKLWVGFAMNAGWAVIFLVSAGALAQFGALGVAVGRLSAYALHAVWTFWYLSRLWRPGYSHAEAIRVSHEVPVARLLRGDSAEVNPDE